METPTLNGNYFMGGFLSALGADLDGLHNKRVTLNDAISFVTFLVIQLRYLLPLRHVAYLSLRNALKLHIC